MTMLPRLRGTLKAWHLLPRLRFMTFFPVALEFTHFLTVKVHLTPVNKV